MLKLGLVLKFIFKLFLLTFVLHVVKADEDQRHEDYDVDNYENEAEDEETTSAWRVSWFFLILIREFNFASFYAL